MTLVLYLIATGCWADREHLMNSFVSLSYVKLSKEIGGQFSQLEEATIVQLQAAMATGQLIARRLAEMYPERIQFLDQRGPHFNAVLEINPDAPAQERKDKGPRGRLHGISLLL